MIRGIKFTSIPVRDQEKALKFYTEKLGFQIMTDQAFGKQRWIELGIPGAETVSYCSRRRDMRTASERSSPCPSGATTCRRPTSR